jgi:hypothetical protein
MRLKTGPQTDAGKAVTSQNARTHGLTAKKLLVLPEERPEFDQLHDQLLDECKPEGVLENELFRQILHAQWNLRRCDQVEQEIFDAVQVVAKVDPASGKSLDPLHHGDNDVPRQLDRIQRYRTAHNRAWHRALRELRNLQTNRLLLADADAPRPPLADEMKHVRYLDARSRAHRNAKTTHTEADHQLKRSSNNREQALAKSPSDAEPAAGKAAREARSAQTAPASAEAA